MSDILLSKIVGVNFNEPTFKMVGGLGIDDVKIRSNWFLQAEVKDAIAITACNGKTYVVTFIILSLLEHFLLSPNQHIQTQNKINKNEHFNWKTSAGIYLIRYR